MTQDRNIYHMASEPAFREPVITECRKLANYIQIEDPGTPNHAARLVWANKVLGYDGVSHADVIQSMITAATGNATLQATAPFGPWLDSDIAYVVNTLIDIQAASVSA